MEALNNMLHIGGTEGYGFGCKKVIVKYDFRGRVKEPVSGRSY